MAGQKFDTMIICSTLNQMVNYLAIMEHGIKKIFNITFDDKQDDKNINLNKKFPYQKWDENLYSVIKSRSIKIEEIQFKSNEIATHDNIIDKLQVFFKNNPYDKSILWNITGGQRHFVMAITEYVKEYRPDKDCLLYYEGDTEKFIPYYFDSLVKNKVKPYGIIGQGYPLTLNIALKLMGFNIKDSVLGDKSKYYQYFFGEATINDKNLEGEYNYYKELYDLYTEHVDLIKIMIESNKNKTDKESSKTRLDSMIEDINKSNKKIPDKIFKGNNLKKLEKSLGKYKNSMVFGYILEKMTFYRMISILDDNKELLDKVADISLGIDIEDAFSEVNTSVDQFDILLLTKAGKLIVFECKSGRMTGDNAKSTNYSTYRIAGVYGAPVLIDPLTDGCDIEENVFKNIKSAEHAANRADLTICRVCSKNNNDYYDLKYYIENILGG
ncbi:hypothetical protein GM661_05575 [Iocasia frigidifontis]|uniref:DUF1887 family protein n=1 Tax=Iocasia fonsfrigidae TaxID=2682810 RepID=A0A8A7K8G1_9FIRM|nr:hypothetical protein [Iocasia fonsfrigidae]QTL97490.1 hypothetical protein GM661_05575 [Iocasia fonsfrigidae]